MRCGGFRTTGGAGGYRVYGTRTGRLTYVNGELVEVSPNGDTRPVVIHAALRQHAAAFLTQINQEHYGTLVLNGDMNEGMRE